MTIAMTLTGRSKHYPSAQAFVEDCERNGWQFSRDLAIPSLLPGDVVLFAALRGQVKRKEGGEAVKKAPRVPAELFGVGVVEGYTVVPKNYVGEMVIEGVCERLKAEGAFRVVYDEPITRQYRCGKFLVLSRLTAIENIPEGFPRLLKITRELLSQHKETLSDLFLSRDFNWLLTGKFTPVEPTLLPFPLPFFRGVRKLNREELQQIADAGLDKLFASLPIPSGTLFVGKDYRKAPTTKGYGKRGRPRKGQSPSEQPSFAL